MDKIEINDLFVIGEFEYAVISINGNKVSAEKTSTGEEFVFDYNRQLIVRVESYNKKLNTYKSKFNNDNLLDKLNACLITSDRLYMFMKMCYADRISYIDFNGSSNNYNYSLIEHLTKSGYSLQELQQNIDKLFPEVIV